MGRCSALPATAPPPPRGDGPALRQLLEDLGSGVDDDTALLALGVPETESAEGHYHLVGGAGVAAISNAAPTFSNGMVWLTMRAYFSQLATRSFVTSKISSG